MHNLPHHLLSSVIIHCLEKPRVRVVNVVPRPKILRAAGLESFWPWNLPRDNIQPATAKAFPKNIILYNSQTSKLDFVPANVAPRDNPGEYTPSAFTNNDSVKSNIVRGNYKEWLGTRGDATVKD